MPGANPTDDCQNCVGGTVADGNKGTLPFLQGRAISRVISMSAFRRFSFLYGWYLYSYVTRNCCALKNGAQQAIAKRPAASLLRIKPWVVIFINLLGFYISLEELFGYVSAFEYSDFCKKTKIVMFFVQMLSSSRVPCMGPSRSRIWNFGFFFVNLRAFPLNINGG